MTDTATAGTPTFADLGLRPELLNALTGLGYETPTPIQATAIPPLVEGSDVLGQARTGTGKTAAFALPLLHRLEAGTPGVQAIILTPTRELAIQVAGAINGYGRHLGPRGVQVLPVYGGQPIYIQLKALRRGVQVVVGTPGRVKDHLERGTLDLSGVRFFGLDEADEMLKMGFIDDVEWILDHAPKTRQVAVFSATLPPRIRSIAERYQRDPVDVSVAQPTLTVPTIEQFSLQVRSFRDKDAAIERLLQTEEAEAVLIFAGTRQACEDVTERLQANGHEVEAVHGGMSQKQREAVVRRLRTKRTKVVIATDVAARGLDVDHIGLVINYDLPRDREVYVHRIGRTGRAGRTGRSISFYRPRERYQLKGIERLSGGKPMAPLHLPTDRELVARRRAGLATQIRETAATVDPGFVKLVEELQAEGLEPAQIAAAAARLVWGESPIELPKPTKRERNDRNKNDRNNNRNDRNNRNNNRNDRNNQHNDWKNQHNNWKNQHNDQNNNDDAPRDPRDWNNQRPDRPMRNDRPRPQSQDPGPLSGGEVELVLPIGQLSRLRPGDVVGAIANETGLPGKVVGQIRILERVTFVAVAAEHHEAILAALTGVHLRGRQLQPRLAHPDGKISNRPQPHRGRPRSSAEDRRSPKPAHR